MKLCLVVLSLAAVIATSAALSCYQGETIDGKFKGDEILCLHSKHCFVGKIHKLVKGTGKENVTFQGCDLYGFCDEKESKEKKTFQELKGKCCTTDLCNKEN